MIAEIFGEKNIDRIRVFYILTLEYTYIQEDIANRLMNPSTFDRYLEILTLEMGIKTQTLLS